MMDFDGFHNYLVSEKRSSPHTVESYRNDLEQFSAYCERDFEIRDHAEVTPPVVRSWLASLMEEKYAATSVHRKLSSVNAFYKFLLRNGKVGANPAHGLPKPKLPKRLPTFVEEHSIKGLYALEKKNAPGASDESTHGEKSTQEFSHLRNTLIVTLFYETGIRRAELLGLKDEDVDFYIGQLKVLGKRNKMRYVPIGKEMKGKLETYLRLRESQNFGQKAGSLFVTDKGKKINKTFLQLTVKSYLSDITTMKKKSPHVLRHTFATHMLNNGADLNVIKEILGHSSLAATQVYTHNSIEKLKSIHSRMHPRNNNVNP